MKRLFLSILLITGSLAFFCFSASAQTSPISKGSDLLTGGFAFCSAGGRYYEDDGNRMKIIQFNPSISTFVTRGCEIGGKFLFGNMSQGDVSMTSWGIGPKINYFIDVVEPKTPAKGSIYPYIGLSVVFTKSTYDGYLDENFTINGILMSFNLGVYYMLSNSVGLIVEPSYEIDNMEVEGGSSVEGNKYNLIIGFSFFIYENN